MSLLKIKSLYKSFPHVNNNKDRMKGLWATLRNVQHKDGIEILKDINFDIKRGESLAVVGRNGAGKSTLLKIISGVLKSSSGEVVVNGSIGALLELGSGFDLEYSGLENLKMAATLAGISEDLDAKIQRMATFADIGEFINEPVKTYSSGMIVRLGFAVITETKPDLLITDEILAVGDEAFQVKCLAWVEQYLSNGGTLLLVSHSIYHIQTICKNAMWLEDGGIKMYGESHKVAKAYQNEILGQLDGVSNHQDLNTYHVADAYISVENRKNEGNKVSMSSAFEVTAKLYTPDGLKPGLSIGVVGYDGHAIYGTYSNEVDFIPDFIDESHVQFQIKFEGNTLLPGAYKIKLHSMTPDQLQMVDTFELELHIEGKTRELGVCRLKTDWS